MFWDWVNEEVGKRSRLGRGIKPESLAYGARKQLEEELRTRVWEDRSN